MDIKSIPNDIKEMSFEEALSELDSIVGDLEQSSNKLDDAITAYERGTLLKQHCEAKLQEAKERVEKITMDASGKIIAEPADIA